MNTCLFTGTNQTTVIQAPAATTEKHHRSHSASSHRSTTVSPMVTDFRNRWYPAIGDAQWNDWRWQLGNRIREYEQLSRMLSLSKDEIAANTAAKEIFPFAVTPYYLSLIDRENPLHPLRRAMVPTVHEHIVGEVESEDPLHEGRQSPVPGLVHRYPDRVLFLVTDYCACYCRYCTRSRLVGREKERLRVSREAWMEQIAYIESRPEIRDVLLSGGDPLTLPDKMLQWLLERLRRIPHVEIIRIGTKVPVVLPMRVTQSLVHMLKRYHPLWMSIHFTHPEELTPVCELACRRLADAGIPLGSQTVLLRDVNDCPKTLKSLFQGLMKSRVRPYYLYQCDPIAGSGHFRTSVGTGLSIMKALRGHTSGYSIPTYVIDAPGGGGKIPMLPDYLIGRTGKEIVLTGFNGGKYYYPEEKTGDEDNYCLEV